MSTLLGARLPHIVLPIQVLDLFELFRNLDLLSSQMTATVNQGDREPRGSWTGLQKGRVEDSDKKNGPRQLVPSARLVALAMTPPAIPLKRSEAAAPWQDSLVLPPDVGAAFVGRTPAAAAPK